MKSVFYFAVCVVLVLAEDTYNNLIEHAKDVQFTEPAFNRLIEAMGPTIKAVAAVNSLSALTAPNLERAGLASAELLQKLLAARDIATDPTLALRLDEAVAGMVQFVNNNNVVPGTTLARLGNSIVIRDATSGTETDIRDARPLLQSPMLAERVDALRKRIQKIDSMAELLSVMEDASRYQDGLRKIGASLRRVAEALGAYVDFRPIESFAFQLFRR